MLRILVADDSAVPELEVPGKKRAHPNLRGEADDREGGRLNAGFSGAFPLAATPKGETLRPAHVFAVVVADEIDLSVIRGLGRGIQVEDPGFLAPTTQQTPELQRARARVPDQNHSPPAENF